MSDRVAGRLVELSHVLIPGQATYSWLPAPRMTEFLSREASRTRYSPGTEFLIHQVEVIGNSGTYLDAPSHRHADGVDLAELPLERLAHLPGLVVDVRAPAGRAMEPSLLSGLRETEIRGSAVLFATGWDRYWGTKEYPSGAPFIGEALASVLVERGVALVGIDALNVDDTDDPARPAHSILLGAGIPVVENLCHLDQLPEKGFRFTAAPVRIAGGSAFPVRAFAVI
jgi:arylformamidase